MAQSFEPFPIHVNPYGPAAARPEAKPASNNAKYQYGHPGSYGACQPSEKEEWGFQKRVFSRARRSSLNIIGIAISHFVPWFLFCFVYGVMSFNLHYRNPVLCYSLTFLGFCVVAVCGLLAFSALKKRKEVEAAMGPAKVGHFGPTWLIFLTATCLLAWVLGITAGETNYHMHLEPFYDLSNLKSYKKIEPARHKGQQLLDAGSVWFEPGTKLQLNMSMGFKSQEMYCVVPIVTPRTRFDTGNTYDSATQGRNMQSYDFWAVGRNCCSGGIHANFHCGEFNNMRASAGLRLMHDDERPYFRLAVQQAEAAFNIRADMPLFFYWMHDPVAKKDEYHENGNRYYLLGIFGYFIMQLFLVIVATIAFSKLVPLWPLPPPSL